MYVTQGKNVIIINFGETTKIYMIEIIVKITICGILVCVIMSVTRHVNLMDV